METYNVVKKVVDAISEARGYAYTAGYLESTLVSIINEHIKDETQLHMLHIRLLGKAIDMKLEKKAA